MPAFFAPRTLLMGVGTVLVLGVSALTLFPPHVDTVASAPVQERQEGQPVGVGPLLEGARGAAPTQTKEADARARATLDLPGAPMAVLDLATALYQGAPLDADDLQGLDPNLLSYVFHPPESLDMGGGSFAREAAVLGRLDVLRAIGAAGVSTHADDGLLFWSALEGWTPTYAEDGMALLEQAALEQGTHRVHEDGFTAFELAATVSLDTVIALIATGANPWTHPSDPDEDLGFPSVMERLSLHAGTAGALGIIEGVIALPSLPVPSDRAHWNTVGNLIDSAILLETEGRKADARRAAAAATTLEGRFGGVPAHFWSQAARKLRPADAPALEPILTAEDALAKIPTSPQLPPPFKQEP